MRGFWHRWKSDDKDEPPSAESKEQESRLSGLAPLHFASTDERITSDERDYASRERIRGGY